MKKVIRFFGDLRTIVFGIALIGGIILTSKGFLEFPKRLAVAEEVGKANGNAVKDLANTIEDYIVVQAVKEEEREKRHEEYKQAQREQHRMTFELIKEVRKSNGQ